MADRPWSLVLQRYIYDKLLPLLKDENDHSDDRLSFDLVSDSVFGIWVRCFTHPSYQPDEKNNYRPLAFQGNRLLELYVADRMANRENGTLSTERLRSFLLSIEWKMEKRRISRSLGLSRHLRTFFEISDQIEEELTDSLFGGFYAALRQLDQNGETRLISIAFSKLFGDYIDRLNVSTNLVAREELIQLHERLGWSTSRSFDPLELGKPKAVKKRGEITGFELKFEMTPQTVSWLKNRGFDVTDTTLSTGRGSDRESTVETAIRNALTNLKEKYEVSFSTIAEEAFKAIPEAVKERMATDRIVSLSTVADIDGGRYILVGTTAEGEKRTLVAIVDKSGLNKTSAEQTMMEMYADRGSTGEIFAIPV